MENLKDETEPEDLAPPAKDEEEPGHAVEDPAEEDPTPMPPDGNPKKPKGSEDEDSYEDGWYQVLKRRAVGAGDQEE